MNTTWPTRWIESRANLIRRIKRLPREDTGIQGMRDRYAMVSCKGTIIPGAHRLLVVERVFVDGLDDMSYPVK